MARSMQKAIDDYNALIQRRGGKFGAFYASDMEELKNIAIVKGGINFWDILFEAVWNGLQAGFMVGYRAGLRDSKKNTEG